MDGGGVEKNLIIISNYLSNHGNKIVLITFNNKFNKFFSKRIKIINFSLFQKSRCSKYFKYAICCFLLIKELSKKDNCVILSFQANIYSLIISKLLRKKIIIRSNSSPSGWTKNFLKNFIFRFMFKKADHIIVNSKDFQKELNKKFNVKSNLIYNPLNKIEIKKKSNEKYNFPFFNDKKSLKLINIARFTDQKDHLTLLKSFREINKKINVKLLIIGYGVNESLIKNFIKQNNLNKKIIVVDFTNNPFRYLIKSDALILTSKFEGLPNVILEALVLKKIVISTNCPTGPSEILNNGKFGTLFKIGDYKKLNKIIYEINQNKIKFKKKAILGYKSLNRFDYNFNCKQYHKLLLKII